MKRRENYWHLLHVCCKHRDEVFTSPNFKINQPHVLSVGDRDAGGRWGARVLRWHRELRRTEGLFARFIWRYPDLLPSWAGKPRFRLDEFTRYGTTRICLSRRGFLPRAIYRERLSTNTLKSFHLPLAYIPRFVYIIWNKQEINSPPNGLSRDTRSSVSRWWRLLEKGCYFFSTGHRRYTYRLKYGLWVRSTNKAAYQSLWPIDVNCFARILRS